MSYSLAATAMTGSIYVGVSGFSYPSWRGRFYPNDLEEDGFLPHYSQNLGSVEINSSFYAFPRESTVENWAEKTGSRFKFSFKAPRQITHILKLGRGAPEAANELSKMLGLLKSKQGAVLFQLPPFLRQNLNLVEGFLAGTSSVRTRVFEFRHESWFHSDTYRILEKAGAGLCIADTEAMNPVFKVTGGMAYFRLRKESYDAKTIGEWASKIRETSRGLSETFVYLRHDETGENAVLAQLLSKKLTVIA